MILGVHPPPTDCLSQPFAFFQRYTMDQNGGGITKTFERTFPELVTINDALMYFRDTMVTKYEFSDSTGSNDRYSFTLEVAHVDTNTNYGMMIFWASQVDDSILASTFTKQAYRPNPRQTYFTMRGGGLDFAYPFTKRNSGTTTVVELTPQLFHYRYNLVTNTVVRINHVA